MYEVLSLKIYTIYPSGMAHWQFLFSKRVIFFINLFVLKNCVKVLMRMLRDIIFMRSMVITSGYISKVKISPSSYLLISIRYDGLLDFNFWYDLS